MAGNDKDEATNDEVIERLRREGQLTRNSGTNSLKSVNVNLTKMLGVFQSIESGMLEQTAIMRKAVMINAEQTETIRRQSELEGLNTVRPSDNEDRTTTTTEEPSVNRVSDGANLSSFLGGIFGGGLTGLMGGPLKIGSLLLKGGLIGLLAPVISEFVADFVAEGLKGIVPEDMTEALGGGAGTVAFGTMIGSIFGKRMAIIGGITGLGIALGNGILDKMGFSEEDLENTVTLFGKEFEWGTVADTMIGAVSFGIAGFLTSAGFLNRLRALTPSFSAASKLRLGIAAGVAAAYYIYGDTVKEYLESDMGVEPDVANWAVDGMATGATIGAMFGPKGMVVGAAIGLALGLGKSMLNWFKKNSDLVKDNTFAKLPAIQAQLASGNDATLNDEQLGVLEEILAEANRDVAASPEVKAENARMAALVEDLKNLNESRMNDRPGATLASIVADLVDTQVVDATDMLIGDAEGTKKFIGKIPVSMQNEPDFKENLKKELFNTYLGNDPRMLAAIDEYELPKFRTGSRGFQQFGEGSLAILHGREAVVPEQTDAGQFLKKYFDDTWKARMSPANVENNTRMSLVTDNASKTAGVVVVNNVTNAPTVNNNRGGNSVRNSTNISGGGGHSSLDYGYLGGVH